MPASVQEFLSTFDSLSELERLEIVSEILKRVTHLDFPPLSDEDLYCKRLKTVLFRNDLMYL
jgi:hypothetical protein